MSEPINPKEEDGIKVDVPVPVLPPIQTNQDIPAPKVSEDLSISTLSTSPTKASTPSPDPALPKLPSPNVGASQVNIYNYSLDKEHEIAKNILDAWLESIREDAERIAEQLRSAAYQNWLRVNNPHFFAEVQRKSASETEVAISQTPQYLEWVASLSPEMRLQQWLYNQMIALRIGLAEGVENFSGNVSRGDPEAIAMLPFMAATLVIGEDLITLAVNSVVTPFVGVSSTASFHHIWQSIATSVLSPLDVQAELGLIGALFATGILYQTTVQNIASQRERGQEKEKNLEFGKRYARNMIQLTSGNVFGDFVRAMLINKLEGAEKLADIRKEQLIAIVKIVLLSTALALVYKVQTGKITGREFDDMVNGRMIISFDSIEAKLVQLIRHYLGALSDKEALSLRTALADYMDRDPKINNLLDPGHAFEGLLQNFQSSGPLAG